MRKYILYLISGLLMLTFSCSDKEKVVQKENESLKKEIEQLKKENEQLKNQSKEDKQKYPTKKTQTEDKTNTYKSDKSSSKSGCTYWITSSSHKRHNSSCRWYKNSNGYCTDNPNEGVACKICGG